MKWKSFSIAFLMDQYTTVNLLRNVWNVCGGLLRSMTMCTESIRKIAIHQIFKGSFCPTMRMVPSQVPCPLIVHLRYLQKLLGAAVYQLRCSNSPRVYTQHKKVHFWQFLLKNSRKKCLYVNKQTVTAQKMNLNNSSIRTCWPWNKPNIIIERRNSCTKPSQRD